jgi:hypothetical protein
MTGEILHGRFAVLERTGPDRYRAFDLRALSQVEVQLLLGGSQYLVLEPEPPVAPPRAATPSPLPPIAEAATPPPPVRASRAAALEAAWFAHGEQAQEADEPSAPFVEEQPDYTRYQQLLEQLAEELSAALFAKYALDTGD